MTARVETSISVAAPPERVWRAWVEEMNQWWTKPYYNDHERVTGLDLEPRLAGRYIEKWGEDGAGFLIGTVVEWLPPARLAHTWTERSWGGVVTLVRIELRPDGDGATAIRLQHEGFERLPDGEEQRKNYQRGWADLLKKAGAFIAGKKATA